MTTDRTVDTSSLDSIVADVVRPSMSDEQKALALYRFLWRTMYHYGWPYMRPEAEENCQAPIKLINVHGYSLCGTRARVLGRLYGRVFGEENTRLVGFSEVEPGVWGMEESPGAFVDTKFTRDYDPTHPMGHTSLDVRYGGRWRLIDPHVHFYAYLRGEGGIASAQDLIADPGLVTAAARGVRGLMPCGDLSRVFYASTFKNWGAVTREAAPDDHAMEITLRRGETYTRYWDRRGPFFWFCEQDRRWGPEYLAPGPRHLCEGEGGWRHYGNGELLYRPRLRGGTHREELAAETGLAPSAPQGLRPARPGRPGRAIFRVRVPYLVVGSRLRVEAARATGSDEWKVWVRAPGGRWHLVWREPRSGGTRRQLDLSPWVSGRYGYEVRFDLSAARQAEHVVLHSMSLLTTFVLNYLALPRRLPGRNRVRLAVS